MDRCFLCRSKLNLWRIWYRHIIANIMEEISCKNCIPNALKYGDKEGWEILSFEVLP